MNDPATPAIVILFILFVIHKKTSRQTLSYVSRGFILDRFLTALLCYFASSFGILIVFLLISFSTKYIVNYLIFIAVIAHLIIVISWIFDRPISTIFHRIFIIFAAIVFASFLLFGQEGIMLLTMFLVTAAPTLYLAYKGISFQVSISHQNKDGYGF